MKHHDQKDRWIVFILAVFAVILYAWAFFQPMWGFYLSAPQYPYGLNLAIYMNHVGGDVSEINILNHYIGMARLDEAAQFERSIAGYGLAGIGLITMLLVFLPGRHYARIFALPALLFPFVFAMIMFVWMYRFGHELSPSAPVRVLPFTPKIIGMGKIGNFTTYGVPGPGFYMILGSAVAAAAAFWLRSRVCRSCVMANHCGKICPDLFLFNIRKNK